MTGSETAGHVAGSGDKPAHPSLRVAVVGAGIVGSCCALALLRDGHQVTLIEAELAGGEQAASFGNGAWFSPGSVVPMSMPGLWRKIPGYLMDRTGPLTIRWSSLPGLLPWLIRFVAAGATVSRVEATARALGALLLGAPQHHQQLAAQAGVPELVVSAGLLYAYFDREAFLAEKLAWRLRRDNQVVWQELEGEALRALAPDLDPRYRFGVFVPSGAHCADPGAYVQALVALAGAQGAQCLKARVQAVRPAEAGTVALKLDQGERFFDRVVIAAGVRSVALARSLGDSLPLASERGYHVVITEPSVILPVPVMPTDGKMANTPTRSGLRVAGQVELAAIDAPPDWRRAEILLEHARLAYPALGSTANAQGVSRWMGHRPSTPDGLPVLGASSRCAQVVYAVGHGHVGLAAAPASAQLVADLITGRKPAIDPMPYRADRF